MTHLKAAWMASLITDLALLSYCHGHGPWTWRSLRDSPQVTVSRHNTETRLTRLCRTLQEPREENGESRLVFWQKGTACVVLHLTQIVRTKETRITGGTFMS